MNDDTLDNETTADETVNLYFAAMRRGAAAEDDLMALFTDDVEYIEPFTEPDVPAIGKVAMRDRLRRGWQTPLPDMRLEVHTVEVDGDTARSTWTCHSPALPQPAKGVDHYTFRDGLISRLEVDIGWPIDE